MQQTKRIADLELLCASLSLSVRTLSRIVEALSSTSLHQSETLSMVLTNCAGKRCVVRRVE